VWLIRPSSALHSIHVKSLKLLITPTECFPIQASSCPTYPSIYCR
jgi:hypothetical protein